MQPSSLETSPETGTTTEEQGFSSRIRRPQAGRLNTGRARPALPPRRHRPQGPSGLRCTGGQSCHADRSAPKSFCPHVSWHTEDRGDSGSGGGGTQSSSRGCEVETQPRPHGIGAHFVSLRLTGSGLASNNHIISQTSHRFKSSTLEGKKNKLMDFCSEQTSWLSCNHLGALWHLEPALPKGTESKGWG